MYPSFRHYNNVKVPMAFCMSNCGFHGRQSPLTSEQFPVPLLKTYLDQLTSYAGWLYRYRRRARPAANPNHQWGYSGLLGGVAHQEQFRLKLCQEESASKNGEDLHTKKRHWSDFGRMISL